MTFDRAEGRVLFDAMGQAYGAARPGYPERVYELLAERCGLGPGRDVLEIGAGSGQATRRLLDVGGTVVAVEPSASLSDELRESTTSDRLRVIVSAFEDAALADGSFDLVVAATSFHWLDSAAAALQRVHRVLRPGGWVALWWNVFGDLGEPDPFHEATRDLLADITPSPSAGAGVPFALDAERRVSELVAARFTEVNVELMRWTLRLTAVATRRLYATYSNIARLDPERRARILGAIERTARDKFHDEVVRRMVTPMYTARRGGPTGDA